LGVCLVASLIAFSSESAGNAAAPASAAPAPATVQFQMRRGHVMVPSQVTNSAPLWLLLDTGYSMTMLHPEHVAAFELRRTGRRVTIVGIAGEEQTEIFEGPEFQFGDASWRPRRVAALPNSSPSRSRRRDGILGSGFFRRFVVEIDSQTHQLRLHEPGTFVYTGSGEILPMRFTGDTPMVEATVQLPNQTEVKARFEIDTGCDGAICLGRHFVEAHGLAPTNSLTGPGGNRSGVGGATRTRESHLPRVRLGRLVVERPEASLFLEGSPVEPPQAGHFGWDLLRNFTVILDYERARLILEKKGTNQNAPAQ